MSPWLDVGPVEGIELRDIEEVRGLGARGETQYQRLIRLRCRGEDFYIQARATRRCALLLSTEPCAGEGQNLAPNQPEEAQL